MTSGTTFSPPPAFGRFRLLHQIGAGVLGPVFRTHDPDEDRLVAIKAFTLDLTPERAAALAEELGRLVALDLPAARVAVALDAGVEDTVPFLAQQYVAGESLDAAIRQYGPAPAPDAARLVSHVAEALDACARIGVFHGALHPRDVLVTPGETHLTGLGVASALERIGARAPVRRPYAAPERETGGEWGAAADLYALAAIAHEVLTGRRALPGTEEPLPGLDEISVADASALRELLEACLDADPERRPATAVEFANAFAASLGLGQGTQTANSRPRRRVKPKAPPRLPGLEDPIDLPEGPPPDVAALDAGAPAVVVASVAGGVRRRRTAPVAAAVPIAAVASETSEVASPAAAAPGPEPFAADDSIVEAPVPDSPVSDPPVPDGPEPDALASDARVSDGLASESPVAAASGVAERVSDAGAVVATEGVLDVALEAPDAAPDEGVSEPVDSGLPQEAAEAAPTDQPELPPGPAIDSAGADQLDAFREDLARFGATGEPVQLEPPLLSGDLSAELSVPGPAGPRAFDTADLSGLGPMPESPGESARRPDRDRRRPEPSADDFRELGSLLADPPVPRALDPGSRTLTPTRRAELYRPLPAAPRGVAPFVAAGTVAGLVAGLALGYWWGSRSQPTPAAPAVTATSAVTAPAVPGTPPPAPSARPDPVARAPVAVPAAPAAKPPASAARPPSSAARPSPSAAAPSPVTQSGVVRVRSTPDRADVFVDGVRRGVTPRNVDRLPFGSHTIRVTRPGYVPQERTVTLDANTRDLRVSFTLTRAGREPAPVPVRPARPQADAPKSAAEAARPAATGSIEIETRPPGARIRLDGRDVGVSPAVVGGVAAGRHTVRLELAGYRPWTTTLDVKAGARARIAASLDPIPDGRDARR